MGCHFLLQRILPAQGSNPHLLHCKADSLPLSHKGSPKKGLVYNNGASGGEGRERELPKPRCSRVVIVFFFFNHASLYRQSLCYIGVIDQTFGHMWNPDSWNLLAMLKRFSDPCLMFVTGDFNSGDLGWTYFGSQDLFCPLA